MRIELELVTVIAEALLEHRLVHEVQAAGATGWTIGPARGEGSRGVRAGDWEGGNIRLETLCSPAVADRLLQALERDFFPHYAVVAFVHPVSVLRGEKYDMPSG
jgi:nitrogen regulatory protein P-II 2